MLLWLLLVVVAKVGRDVAGFDTVSHKQDRGAEEEWITKPYIIPNSIIK